MTKYIPTTMKIENKTYGLMLVELDICYLCKKTMIYPPPAHNYGNHTFPAYYIINFATQIKRAGWVPMSNEKVDDEYVCIECVKTGKITFLCYYCERCLPSNMQQERFGDPPEYLCTDCYAIVPAQKWDTTVKKLEDDHKYDFD